jgi:hypothetical protein
MDKNTILNYVMNTPRNTNRAVLEGMLDSIASAGGGSSQLTIAELSITSDTSATCELSHDEITSLLDAKKPVLIVWAYQPEGAPFVLMSGSHLAEHSTGTIGIDIRGERWSCPSGYDWQKLSQ